MDYQTVSNISKNIIICWHKFGVLNNFSYIRFMEKLKITLNVIVVTCVIGLAISYVTQLIPMLPKLSFLEAVGVYCLWTPLHHFLNTFSKDNTD